MYYSNCFSPTEEDRILDNMDPENILERWLRDHDDLCILEFGKSL